ncbi:SusC/RagA family TonB-linked outer membrane protein [Chitinophaga sp.]|uniref:SusC/RagA family TonB-linked outer membrane protein n=1 Tax=Chitinophaga sp. TaxID=1869181 RepID=UPI002B7218CE|nr:SusC/RagA family TonB-linked outer membrane protein [Chitinophaga sp.]HWV68504.1 SusC/RagA family TonB-linked outer membrane protein [Chitinophaga sp.]
MRTTLVYAFFMVIGMQVMLAMPGHSQGVTETHITLGFNNEPLVNAFRAIEKQTDYLFAFQPGQVAGFNNISLPVANRTVGATLDLLLANTNLEYRQVGVNIIISRKTGSLADSLSGGQPAATDTSVIKGKVIAFGGMPLAGASVIVAGTKKGAVANEKGEFSLVNVNPNGILQISFLGFASQEIRISNRTNILVTMQQLSDAGKLNEVVVQGYGMEKKRDLVGTITKITAKDIENMPVNNPLSALQGLVPGMEITNTAGTPGATPAIRIRGINSVATSSRVLILIDGVQGDLSYISPSDIASVEILKDASATAIYGARGSDGVVLVTTKKGKRNTPARLNFQAYTGITQTTHLQKMMNTEEFRTIRKEGFANDAIEMTPANAPDMFLDSTVNTNWGKTLYKPSLTQDYQLNFSGGSDQVNFYISGGYRNEDAIVKGDWYQKRFNARIGLDAKISDKLSIGGGAAFSDVKSRLYNESVAAAIYYALPMLPADSAGITNLKAYGYATLNPNRLLTTFNLGDNKQFLGNFYFNYNIWNRLFFRTAVSYQVVNGQTTTFLPTTSFANTSTVAQGAYGFTNNNTFTVEPQLNYALDIGRHSFKFLAGGTILNTFNSASLLVFSGGYPSDLLYTLASASNANLTSKTVSEVPYKFASAFGRISYKYADKYLLEGVYRRDGSSRFGNDRKYGNFWSVGGGWIFSDEAFIKTLFGDDFFGKLKVTYGTTGSDNIGDFGYVSYNNTTSSGYGSSSAVVVSNLANPYLQWEQTKKLDFGLDLNMLRNRLNINLSYFRHQTTNTLFSQPISAVTGFQSIASNLSGKVNNNGLEISVTAIPVETKSFSWTSVLNFSTIHNELVSLPGLQNGSVIQRYTYRVGEPLAINWGYRYLGVDPATGLAKFEDVDKSGTISSYTPDYVIIGKSIPDFYGGWNNTFSWKRLELGIMTQFVSGIQKGYNVVSYAGSAYNPPASTRNRWQHPGDITDIPRAAAPGTTAANNNGLVASSAFAYSDASYIRIKNISLSYSVPGLERFKLSNLRLFVTGYNLVTITGFKGDDPESNNNFVPMTKMYTTGVNVTF